MTRKEINVAPVMEEGEGRIVLFRPNIPKKAVEYISGVLESRWIGQGPRVDEFEKKFEASFGGGILQLVVAPEQTHFILPIC